MQCKDQFEMIIAIAHYKFYVILRNLNKYNYLLKRNYNFEKIFYMIFGFPL